MRVVDVPELRYLYIVVVFSSTGWRPDQHKLSLGDLDGDTCSVMWDQEMVKAFQGNFPPGEN